MAGDAYEETVHSFEEYKQQREGGSGRRFELMSLAELLQLPDPAYHHLVADMLPAGGSSIVVAKPKVGKTTLVQQLARCVAGGTDFLGREVKRGSVVYLAFEEKPTEAKKSFLLAEADPDWPIYFYFGEPPDEKFDALRVLIEEYQPALVVIDTLGHWMGLADFNDYGQVGAAMRPLHSLARTVTAHVMVVHHAGKGGGRAESIDSPLGSTALSASVDTIMLLSDGEGENERIVETRQRYGDHLPKTKLSFDKDKRTFTSEGTVGDGRKRELEGDILGALGDSYMTESALRSALRCEKQRLLRTLDSMVEAGMVTRVGAGVRGQAFQYHVNYTYQPQPNGHARTQEQGEEAPF